MRTYRIAVIPGDGIGPEVVQEGIRVLETAGNKYGLAFQWEHIPRRARRRAVYLPENGIDLLKEYDAIYLGAVGYPGVPDHLSLWGLLIPIRRYMHQYVNLRPARLFRGVKTPLAYKGTEEETVVQESVFTRRGVDRTLRYAFDRAKGRPKKHLTSATKSNGIIHTMPFWDERFQAIAAEYPEVKTDQYHIDILTAHFVNHPDWFDVVVASNLFGDILSDLGPAVAGSIGIAPSGNINPEKEYPSMFEPVHGSAPDITGKGIANPIGAIWSGAMMLEHLGHGEAARAIETAIQAVLADPTFHTPDLSGKATTKEVGRAVVAALPPVYNGRRR